MVQAGIAPDRGDTEILRRTGGRADEHSLVFAVMGFHGQDAAHAAEGSHVSVAGVAVQPLASLVVV